MSDRGRRRPVRNAGAFLSPYGTFPVPIHTLSDEIPHEPDELEAERRGPLPYERRRHGLWFALFGAGLLLVAVGIAAVAVPAATGVILLGALLADVTLGVVLYVVQRKRHW